MKKTILLLVPILIIALSWLMNLGGEYECNFVEAEELTIEEIENKVQLTIDISQKIAAINATDNIEWFKQYKGLLNQYPSDLIDKPETIYDYFNNDDILLIQRAVETECYQADFNSKCNVASVILNRYYSGLFGETIEEIITSPKQFAYGRKKITEDTVLAVEYAFEIEDATNGAIGFHSNKKTKTFNGWEYVMTDCAGHHFYKIKENK